MTPPKKPAAKKPAAADGATAKLEQKVKQLEGRLAELEHRVFG